MDTVPIEYLLAVTVDFDILIELIKLSSIFKKVWSPEAPTHVALRPCLGPIFGIGAGIQYQGERGLILCLVLLLWPGWDMSWGDNDGGRRPSCPFYKTTKA